MLIGEINEEKERILMDLMNMKKNHLEEEYLHETRFQGLAIPGVQKKIIFLPLTKGFPGWRVPSWKRRYLAIDSRRRAETGKLSGFVYLLE